MEDLKPSPFTTKMPLGIARTPAEVNSVIDELYNYVTDEAMKSINWYYTKRGPKRCMGLFLRYSSIFLVALAGILPIIIAIFEQFKINSAWSAIAVALAVLMIGIDKFGGFTTGWIRYVLAAQKLSQALEEFRFIWKEEKLKLAGTTLSSEDIQNLMIKCKEFLQKVQLTVSEETQKWVTEFQSALSDIETATKAAAESAKETIRTKEKGAMSVQILNGKDCQGPWTLELDGKVIKTDTGSSVALTDLNPGIISLKITGTIKEQIVHYQIPVIIKGGEIATVSLTLV